MKIKNRSLSYEAVLALPKEKQLPPKQPPMFFRWLLKTLSAGDLKATNFTLKTEGMERLGKDEPALFLMNHSSFIDLKIAGTILYPRPFNIICTSDGFVGKNGLMRNLGCIPTKKFITDPQLVRDMLFAVRDLKDSILMYPEASYTFDGTATPLPSSLGKLLKMLNVPLVMIKTEGAFLRDPLYNMLQLRKVNVSATMSYILSPEEIKEKSVDEHAKEAERLAAAARDAWAEKDRIAALLEDAIRKGNEAQVEADKAAAELSSARWIAGEAEAAVASAKSELAAAGDEVARAEEAVEVARAHEAEAKAKLEAVLAEAAGSEVGAAKKPATRKSTGAKKPATSGAKKPAAAKKPVSATAKKPTAGTRRSSRTSKASGGESAMR